MQSEVFSWLQLVLCKIGLSRFYVFLHIAHWLINFQQFYPSAVKGLSGQGHFIISAHSAVYASSQGYIQGVLNFQVILFNTLSSYAEYIGH